MAEYAQARVELWGLKVGSLIEDETGKIVFQYEPDFRTHGLEISPIHLPLRQGAPFSFPEIQRKTAFLGLPGVFADALPDRFGNEIIRRYFEEVGRPGDALSPVQKLLYVGSRTMGALSFHKSLDRKPGNDAPLRVRTLVEQARHVIEGDPDVAIPEIMQVGGSAGGARAKALILWNRDTDIIKSGFATEEPGDEHWLIKFDGVTTDSGGVGMKGTDEGQPWGRIEWCYAQMAREAGITMAETHLLRDADLAHFMTRRFDRESAPHPHMHSLAGMQHVDFNEQYQVAYETYFDTIRLLEIGQEAINQAFRRMVFSVSTINFDDHPKNFAFLMSRDGRWEISPAYDVAYAEGKAWTRQHQMSMNGKFSNITRADLRQIADNFDIPVHGKEIVDEVIESLDSWRRHAAEAGVPAEMIDYLEQRFERLP